MVDKSITGLTAAGTITGAELIKIVQGGNSRKVDLDAVIAALAPTGIDGVDGRTILNGTTVPDDGSDGVDGDFYLRTTNYVMYGPKAAGSWGAGVSIVGPPGADGADGDDGLDGTDGTSLLSGSGAPDDGADGSDGDMYLDYTAYDIYGPKTAGAWGSGTSILGTVGSDGKTILNGVVAPTTEGTNGDFYIDTATTTIYGPKAAGVWPTGVSLIGPPGDDGLDGTDGTDGTDGVDGSTVLSGTGAPSGGLGLDGDFYIDTASLSFYGPKTGGSWGSASSIVGITDAPNDAVEYIRKSLGWHALTKPFDPSIFILGKPLSAELLLRYTAVRGFTFPSSMTGSYGTADVASTGTAVFSFEKNGTPFATLTFTASGTGVYAAASPTTFVAGDVLTITGPSPQDTTLADVSINLKGSAT